MHRYHLQQVCVFLLRLAVTSLLAIYLILPFEQSLVKILIPLYQWFIHIIDDRFDILFLGIIDVQGTHSLQLNVAFNHDIVIHQATQAITTNLIGASSLLIQNICHPLLIFIIAIIAWPAQTLVIYLVRALSGLPLILLIMILDAPVQLLAAVLNNFSQQVDSPWVNSTWLIYWSDFLNGGGIFALSLACSVMTIHFSANFKQAITENLRNVIAP